MNRKSLFGRLAKSTMVSSAAERQEYFRVHLEPLEDRKMLALDVFYAENWVNLTNPDTAPVADDSVTSTHFTGTKTYGTDAFGRGGGTISMGGSLPFIHDAIVDSDVEVGATLTISGATHQESDIVVSKSLVIIGQSGNLIVPEVTSSGDTSDFGAGTHSGFIITAGTVSITGVHLDGNGGGVGGSLNYHHGITTLYTNPGGGYVTVRAGTLSAMQIGEIGEHAIDGGTSAETVPNLLIDGVTVENVFWHGITISAREDETFHDGGGEDLEQVNLNILNSVVTNVGPGTKTANHIGILMQNIVSNPATVLGNMVSNTVTNVGIGVKAAPYGTESLFYQDGDGIIEFGGQREDLPSNNASGWFNEVNQAAIYGFDIEFGTEDDWNGNRALSGSAGAVGHYILHSKGLGAGIISEGYGVGMQVLDNRLDVNAAQAPWKKWRFGGTWEADDIVRMTIGAQSVQATTGSTSIPTLIDTFVTALNASGLSEFSVLTWSRVDNDLYAKADSPAANATGTLATFDVGLTAADTQTVSGGTAIGDDDILTNMLAGSSLTGPGTGSAGSVGLLLNNVSAHNNSTAFLLSTGVVITGFETGVRVAQDVTPGNQRNNYLAIDRAPISGNLTDIVVGAGSLLTGETFGVGTIRVEGNGRIDPRFQQDNDVDPWFYDNSTQPAPPAGPNTTAPIIAYDRPTTLGAVNITLSSSSTFTPILTGETSSLQMWDFNAAQTYVGGPITGPQNFNQSFNSDEGPPSAGTLAWGGLVTQDGGGQVFTDGTNNGPFGAAFYSYDFSSTSWAGGDAPTFYYLDGETFDLTGVDHINVKMKLEEATDAKIILFGLSDWRGNVHVWGLPTSEMNAVSYTTVSVSLLSPVIEVFEHEEDYDANDATDNNDDGIDLSKISGYLFLGDGGFVNGNVDIPLEFRVDNVDTTSQKNSVFRVSGAIDLAGATLAPNVLASYSPANGETFTIIDKTSGGAVTGTFAGMPEGQVFTADGKVFKISYTGGDGNDVVLTASTGAIVGRHLFYNQSRWDGNNAAPNPTQELTAIATDKSAYLPGSGLAVFSAVSSFSRGINGIMVDIAGSHPSITTDDFIFKVGNNNIPSSWTTAPAPSSLSVVAGGGGVSGSDRVEIVWATGSITNQWLEVQVLATADTGLPATDVHFWGSKVGDNGVGTGGSVFSTTTGDAGAVFANLLGTGSTLITNIYDYNRIGGVSTQDAGLVFSNISTIRRINIGAGGPFAPEGADGGDGGGSAVASALAAGSSSDGGSDSGWVAASLATVVADAGSGGDDTAKADSARSAAVADVADELEDDSLDGLLADLAAA